MQTTKIYLDEFPYYFMKMRDPDTTHFKMSIDDFTEDDSVSCFHVGQLHNQPYYDDLCEWLKNEYEIDGNKYYTI